MIDQKNKMYYKYYIFVAFCLFYETLACIYKIFNKSRKLCEAVVYSDFRTAKGILSTLLCIVATESNLFNFWLTKGSLTLHFY